MQAREEAMTVQGKLVDLQRKKSKGLVYFMNFYFHIALVLMLYGKRIVESN